MHFQVKKHFKKQPQSYFYTIIQLFFVGREALARLYFFTCLGL
jgi:hypothetical protein